MAYDISPIIAIQLMFEMADFVRLFKPSARRFGVRELLASALECGDTSPLYFVPALILNQQSAFRN